MSFLMSGDIHSASLTHFFLPPCPHLPAVICWLLGFLRGFCFSAHSTFSEQWERPLLSHAELLLQQRARSFNLFSDYRFQDPDFVPDTRVPYCPYWLLLITHVLWVFFSPQSFLTSLLVVLLFPLLFLHQSPPPQFIYFNYFIRNPTRPTALLLLVACLL